MCHNIILILLSLSLVSLCNGTLPTCDTNSICAELEYNEQIGHNNHQNTKYGYVCCKCSNKACPSSAGVTYSPHTKSNAAGWRVTNIGPNTNNANALLCPNFCNPIQNGAAPATNVPVDNTKFCVYTDALRTGMADANKCGQAYLGEQPNTLYGAKNGYFDHFEYYDEDDDYYMDDDEYFINYISDASMLDDFMEQFKLQQENAYYKGYQNGYLDAKKEIKQKKQLSLKRDIHKHGKTHYRH